MAAFKAKGLEDMLAIHMPDGVYVSASKIREKVATEVAVERARIRRELLKEIEPFVWTDPPTNPIGERKVIDMPDLLAALDHICPEEG